MFGIAALTTAIMTDGGVVEYDGTHTQDCPVCGYIDTVDDFRIPGFYVTFETYTPHSLDMGNADRRGWWMPGEWLFDERPEEHGSVQDAIVEWAVGTLKREGAIYPSDSPCDDARWWSTEDETTSFETGETMVKSFHFEGFHLDTQRLINKELSQ